jgi:diguanylate cyclase (GGDEF)-like protein
MLAVYAIISVVWILRGFALFTGKLTHQFNEVETVQQLLLVATVPISVALGLLGCIILASEKLHEQLEQKSRFDALTNCLSRSTILEEVQKEILRSVRQKSSFAVMMMDLDHFKVINDTLGHLHGDRILLDFSNNVTEMIRQIDRLGRIGGDEFLVLLPDTTEEAARNVATRIYAAGNRDEHLSWQVSIGIAVWGGANDSLESLMDRADKSLYQQKARKKMRTNDELQNKELNHFSDFSSS